MTTTDLKNINLKNSKDTYIYEYNKLNDLQISNLEKHNLAKKNAIYKYSCILECYTNKDSKELEGYQYTVDAIEFLKSL